MRLRASGLGLGLRVQEHRFEGVAEYDFPSFAVHPLYCRFSMSADEKNAQPPSCGEILTGKRMTTIIIISIIARLLWLLLRWWALSLHSLTMMAVDCFTMTRLTDVLDSQSEASL